MSPQIAENLGRASPGDHGPPTMRELMAFIRVAEELHFGRAARGLGLAQSSLSETLRRLEHRLNAVLLERTSRRVELTHAGHRLLPIARRIVENIELAQDISAVATPPRITLEVGMEGEGAAELTGYIFSEYKELHPDVDVIVSSIPGYTDEFLRSGVDVAIVRSPLIDPRLQRVSLGWEPRGIIMSRAMLTKYGNCGGHFMDYIHLPFVALGRDGDPTTEFWLGATDRGVRPEIARRSFTVPNTHYALSALDLLSTGSPSGARARPALGLHYIPVEGLSPGEIAVVARQEDARPWVTDFLDCARRAAVAHRHAMPDFTPGAAPERAALRVGR